MFIDKNYMTSEELINNIKQEINKINCDLIKDNTNLYLMSKLKTTLSLFVYFVAGISFIYYGRLICPGNIICGFASFIF